MRGLILAVVMCFVALSGCDEAKKSKEKADACKTRSCLEGDCDVSGGVFCAALGQMYYNGTDGSVNKARARHFMRKACDGNYAIGCISYGSMLRDGEGGSRNTAAAAKYYQRGCELGYSGSGC